MDYLILLVGFAILLGSAELLVRGAVTLARHWGISPMVIGMTIVALGTSAPELVVSVGAALSGAGGLAIGNVVGSNIANVLLIVGASAMIAPIISDPASFKRDGMVLSISSIVFAILCWQGVLSIFAGVVLLSFFMGFLFYSYWRETHQKDVKVTELHAAEDDEIEGIKGPLWVAVVSTLAGLGFLMVGAELLVDSGVNIARSLGVSEEVIGLTMIALGTSLPELAASGVAALRGHSEVALGNVVGSNLFNMLAVMGTTVVIHPISVSQQILSFDLWVMLASTFLLLALLVIRHRVNRFEATLFLAFYVAYIAVQAKGVENVFPAI
ncbi:MAG: calcium/sodium antiporter [Alphaproteobacteria bacterium]|nr:calcium/sodium antiporter [Rhodospirillales bacterium]MCW9046113.1 calcium/sodium antiporter [Alphaproteobacteria bacterium]